MARTTRTRKASALGTTGIIADTAEQEAKKVSDIAGDEIIYIACGMPLGLKFDDVDNGNGGAKTVVFPGVNHALRGAGQGRSPRRRECRPGGRSTPRLGGH